MKLALTVSGALAVVAAARAAGRRRPLPSGMGIPHGGVMVRAADVRRHRYLAAHGLPHSPGMASARVGIGK